MDAHQLYDWVMSRTPLGSGHSPENTVMAIAPGGGKIESSISRIRGTRGFIKAHQINQVWVCHTDSKRDPYIPTLEKSRELLTCTDGWSPKQIHVWDSFPGANTATQATNVAERARETPDLQEVVCSAEAYHVGRFGLTVAQALHKADIDSVKLSILPTENTAAVEGTAVSQSLEEEIERIRIYQASGDVATYEVASHYFT